MLKNIFNLFFSKNKTDPTLGALENHLASGKEYLKHHDLQLAIRQFEKAIELKPNHPEANYLLGTAFAQAGENHKATLLLKKAIQLSPTRSSAYTDLGTLYTLENNMIAAKEAYEKASRLEPDNTRYKTYLANSYKDSGEIERAIELYNNILESHPDDDFCRWCRSLAYLSLGKYKEGWQDYKARFSSNIVMQRELPIPACSFPDFQDLKNKDILIYGEQGLGDEILFSTCIPDIATVAHSCAIECDPKLAPIFRRSFPECEIYEKQSKFKNGKVTEKLGWLKDVEKVDCCLPAGDLPSYFRNNITDFPQRRNHLKADHMRTAYYEEKLDQLGKGVKIGISWRGGTVTSRAKLRSIPLKQFIEIFDGIDCHLINLQYTNCDDEIQKVSEEKNIAIHNWKETLSDYDEVAALTSALDMVISVQTAIIHLAGALGTPVWVLLPTNAEWRYRNEGETMPWYPSARLFRQDQSGEWGPLITKVQHELSSLKNISRQS